MITTKNRIVTVQGVNEKPQSPDFGDNKFANFGFQSGKNSSHSSSMNDLGVCSPDYNVSKEGIGVGGYDGGFTVL
jgi:hypothetical protein